MNNILYQLMSRVSGQPFDPSWAEKAPAIMYGIVFAIVFFVAFFAVYKNFFWAEPEARRLFFWSVGLLCGVIILKYGIYHIAKGYIPDRLLFYALPSPRAKSIWWFLPPVTLAVVFLAMRQKIETLSRQKFLLVLFGFFILFTLAVAGIRDGVGSIVDPLTRTRWEYSGNIPLVVSAREFLHDYIALQPQLALHTSTHPPGYTMFLYTVHSLIPGNLFALALSIVAGTGLVLWPLYYLWRRFFSESAVRCALELFVFVPSVVIITGTSVDALFMLLVWTAYGLCYAGWQRRWPLAFLGGVVGALALFSNYLFLLTAPVWLFFVADCYRRAPDDGKKKIVLRCGMSLLGFLLFFLSLWSWSGYSIIGNFFSAHAASREAVGSNFASPALYGIYAAMNAVDFVIYLGVPMAVWVFFQYWRRWKETPAFFRFGAAYVVFLIVMGIFQGEVERLWLFVVPMFLTWAGSAGVAEKKGDFDRLLSLQVLQIILVQTLFYTYW